MNFLHFLVSHAFFKLNELSDNIISNPSNPPHPQKNQQQRVHEITYSYSKNYVLLIIITSHKKGVWEKSVFSVVQILELTNPLNPLSIQIYTIQITING